MKRNILNFVMIFILFSIVSCNDELQMEEFDLTINESISRAIIPYEFDWENVDFMPTPPGQSPISVPWIGAGSISSLYGLDIANDYKKSEGWQLLYNTFDPNSPAPLVNPYFVLYNKYNGLMRIYLYVTTQFTTTSSYLQDGISIVSNHQTTLLNFLGKEAVDLNGPTVRNYQQIQPCPPDGSLPFASNKWYMLQYEMAYDPNLKNIPYNEIQLSWHLNYFSITNFSFGGSIEGQLNGIMGSSAQNNNPISAAGSLGQSVGSGVLAGIGQNVLLNSSNNLGLKPKIYESITTGLGKAVSSSVAAIPGALIGIASAIFKRKETTININLPLNFTLEADISLTGTGTSSGSFPSSPNSFWVPGTNIPSSAIGYIPLVDKTLGVVSFKDKPKISTSYLHFTTYSKIFVGDDPWLSQEFGNNAYIIDEINTTPLGYQGWQIFFNYWYNWNDVSQDYSHLLEINPELLKEADVEVIHQEFLVKHKGELINQCRIYDYFHDTIPDLYLRFTIEIKPKNGSASHIIMKSIVVEQELNTGTANISPSYLPFYMDLGRNERASLYNDEGICGVCGYTYDMERGLKYPEMGIDIPAGISFWWRVSEYPAFRCPICLAPLSDFCIPRIWVGDTYN